MLKNKQVVFQIKRYSMSNVYTSVSENMDLMDNLSKLEMQLYMVLKESILKNPTPTYFESSELAKLLKVKSGSIDNAKSALKRKGYALIIKFKDENNNPMVKVIVGKDQVELYNLGLNIEITNAKAYNRLIDKYPINDPNISTEEREKLVAELNADYKIRAHEYK